MAYMRHKEEVVVVGGLDSMSEAPHSAGNGNGPIGSPMSGSGSIESLSSLAQSVLRIRSSDRTPLLKTTKLCSRLTGYITFLLWVVLIIAVRMRRPPTRTLLAVLTNIAPGLLVGITAQPRCQVPARNETVADTDNSQSGLTIG